MTTSTRGDASVVTERDEELAALARARPRTLRARPSSATSPETGSCVCGEIVSVLPLARSHGVAAFEGPQRGGLRAGRGGRPAHLLLREFPRP